MSQPDQESIANEIRTARIAASPELRARVRAIAATAPAAPAARPHRRLPWRRIALVGVPACVAVALAASLTIGLSGSGHDGSRSALRPELAPAPLAAKSDTARSGGAAGTGSSGNLPATSGRAQVYEAELTLKVGDLSAATKRALRLTRGFRGYVRSVEYGSGAERGVAHLVVRVPVGSVQEALVRYSAIGRILDQHVSIQDVQPRVDAQFRKLQAQRGLIAKLQAALENPGLSVADRQALEQKLVAARRQLAALQRQQARLLRTTSFATVSLDLHSKAESVVAPSPPSRIGRAFHRSGQVLADEAKVLVYVLVVGAPFFVLGAFALGGLRLRRRQSERRLLSTS